MNKLKIIPYCAKTKLFMYALLLISFYLLYAIINTLRGITTKEGMFNARSLTTQLLCRDDKCMKGCKEPTKITEKCGKTIYRDLQNKCYKICPYTCSEKGDGCISNEAIIAPVPLSP